MRGILHQVIRRLYPYNSVRTVFRGPLRGCRFIVQPGIAATMAWGLDNMNLGFLASKIRSGQTVYDVGANRGQMALFFARYVGANGRVLAFEPVPENHSLIMRNAELNGFANIDCFEIALSSAPGPRNLLFDPARHTMGVFPEAAVKLGDWQRGIDVRCATLDRLISQGQPMPDVVKIDVEGAAADVIAGGDELLRRKRPGIYLELHALQRDAPEVRLLDVLRDRYGYRITEVSGSLNEDPGVNWGAAVWCEASSRASL